MARLKKSILIVLFEGLFLCSSCGIESGEVVVKTDASKTTESVAIEKPVETDSSTTEMKETQIEETDLDSSDTSTTEEKVENSGYLLLDSDSRFIQKEELYSFDAKECMLARNEIFARNGRKSILIVNRGTKEL